MPDLAVLAQDPRFGGGVRALTEAFWRGAVELGRDPSLLYVAHPSLAAVPLEGSPLTAPGLRAFAPRLDAANQLAAGYRLAARLRAWRSVWVVAAVASYGSAAARSGRPYACWLATPLEDEWRSRRPGLPRSRRLALAVSAPVLRRLEREVLRRAAAVYGISPTSAAGLAAAAGLPAERVRVLPIPVDTGRFSPGPDARAPLLLFVGRVGDPRKNVGALLAAFREIRARLPEARLRLVGGRPDGAVPEGVEVVERALDVAPHMREAALFVLPSLQEGFGIVAAEALASGTPVLTTPSGGPEELVRASGGGRVLAGFGAEELASVALELLESPGGLAELGHAGRRYVEREHSPERFRECLGLAFSERG